MESVEKKLELILKQSEMDKAELEQLLKFEETIKNLQKLVAPLLRASRSLPLLQQFPSCKRGW